MWWTVSLLIGAVVMAALVVFVIVGLFEVLGEPIDRAAKNESGSAAAD
jgi:hypothetical protein